MKLSTHCYKIVVQFEGHWTAYFDFYEPTTHTLVFVLFLRFTYRKTGTSMLTSIQAFWVPFIPLRKEMEIVVVATIWVLRCQELYIILNFLLIILHMSVAVSLLQIEALLLNKSVTRGEWYMVITNSGKKGHMGRFSSIACLLSALPTSVRWLLEKTGYSLLFLFWIMFQFSSPLGCSVLVFEEDKFHV